MNDGLNSKLLVRYSGHGLNTELLVRYSGHGLNNQLLAGIWIANKWKFVIQIFPLFRCSLFRSPLYFYNRDAKDTFFVLPCVLTQILQPLNLKRRIRRMSIVRRVARIKRRIRIARRTVHFRHSPFRRRRVTDAVVVGHVRLDQTKNFSNQFLAPNLVRVVVARWVSLCVVAMRQKWCRRK